MGELPPHAVIDRYRVQRKLGQGGMGSVYRVQDLDSGEILAMKVVHPEAAERFLSEARALAALRHPNIIRFHGIWPMPDGTFALIMDYLVGQDLQSSLSAGALTRHQQVIVLHQAALGLDYCHSRDVVHRDIKPANIMVTGDGAQLSALLVDFGLGKDRRLDMMQTEVEQIAGTLPFMSPEQVADFAGAGASADQWSLAVTAWYCFTGRVPFPDAPYSFQQAGRITQLSPAAPAELDHVFERAFARDPGDRFHTCVDMTRLIGAALGLDLPLHATDTRRQIIKERVLPLVPEYDFSDRRTDPLWGFSTDQLATLIRRVVASRGRDGLTVQGVAIKIRVRGDSLVVDLPGRHRALPRVDHADISSPPDPRVRHLENVGWISPRGLARPWSLVVPIDHDPADVADRVMEALEVGYKVTPELAYKDL